MSWCWHTAKYRVACVHEHEKQILSQIKKCTTFILFYRKRPTLEEMQAHRWLNPADYMFKKRERAHFTTNRIQVKPHFGMRR